MFRFEEPTIFWALIGLVVMFGLFLIQRRRLGRNLSWPRFFLPFFAFLFCIIGFARPQSGRLVVSQKGLKTNVMLAVDVSKSMLGTDVLPTRLGFTASFLEKLVQRTRGVRFGLFPFAQDGYLMLPFTSDSSTLIDMLQPLTPSMMTDQGTDFNQVFDGLMKQLLRMENVAKEKMQDWPSTQVVMISDGETHVPLAPTALQEFKTKRIPVHTIFVGTSQGSMIPLDNAMEKVQTIGNPQSLKEISRETGGVYFTANYDQVYRLVDAISSRAKFGALTSTFKLEKEFFPYCFAIALILFILEFLLGGWEFAFQKMAWVLLFLPAFAFADETVATKKFNEAVKAMTTDPKTGMELLQDALNETQDPILRKKAYFNQANILLKSGELKQALYAYQQAMDQKTENQKFQTEADKKISENMSLAFEMLKELKKKAQQEGKEKGDEPQEEKDRKGPQKDYESQQFSEKEKKKMYDLLSDEEMQTMMRIQQQRNQAKPKNRTGKPW